MKEYPSISRRIDRDLLIYAFDKLDGSNIRAEWTRKNGFYKFGSRTVLIDHSSQLGEAIDLIKAKYEEGVAKIFTQDRIDRAVCFFEFFGPNSFAGFHQPEVHQVVLIDVNPHKRGIDPPSVFIKKYGHLGIPKCLHIGKANHDFEELVCSGLLDGMTFEGVVCKGVRKGRHLTMFKIKNREWIAKLRGFCKDDDKLFNNLL